MNSVYTILSKAQNLRPDTTTVPQERLDLVNRDRTNIFPWRGQFSPQLIESLLNAYAGHDSSVLDPFAGSGTTLFEASRMSLSCFGAEINPAAVEMARTVHFVTVGHASREQRISQAQAIVERHLPLIGDYNLFVPRNKKGVLPIEKVFLKMLDDASFNPLVYNIIVNTLIRYFGSNGKGRKEPLTALLAAFKRHSDIINALPHNNELSKVYQCDARNLPLSDQSIDIIVTSPPYINVFNYHQNYRKAMELQGWDLLRIAKSEIGSNRKNRGNRFLTVIQYSIDMLQAFFEMRRVIKANGRIIVIIGRESRVRHLSFQNHKVVSAVALGGAGLKLISRQERKFINRFGEKIYEDILHFMPKGSLVNAPDEFARSVGIHFLKENLDRASGEVKRDIELAIENAEAVTPSPLLKYNTIERIPL